MQIICLTFSHDGNILAAGCANGHIYIYKLTDGKWAQLTDMTYGHYDKYAVRFFLYLSSYSRC